MAERIGRYRVVRVLGEGSFGRVYLAADEELQRQVAVKVPHRHQVVRPADVEAYLAEGRTLAGLDHPHIVPVYDVGRTDDGLCFVVSKYIEGSDLARRIAGSRPPLTESSAIVAAVAEALHCAHLKGLVHRDVKPENILIDAAGRPYLADFGIALREEDFGRRTCFAGTPYYMSPEQARGEGHLVDGRSDLFSLGVVLYELLTGRLPFRGENLAGLLEQIAKVEARPPRQIDDAIPRELERICLKALAKRVSERYTTAKDMADDLRQFLAPSPSSPATETVSIIQSDGKHCPVCHQDIGYLRVFKSFSSPGLTVRPVCPHCETRLRYSKFTSIEVITLVLSSILCTVGGLALTAWFFVAVVRLSAPPLLSVLGIYFFISGTIALPYLALTTRHCRNKKRLEYVCLASGIGRESSLGGPGAPEDH